MLYKRNKQYVYIYHKEVDLRAHITYMKSHFGQNTWKTLEELCTVVFLGIPRMGDKILTVVTFNS